MSGVLANSDSILVTFLLFAFTVWCILRLLRKYSARATGGVAGTARAGSGGVARTEQSATAAAILSAAAAPDFANAVQSSAAALSALAKSRSTDSSEPDSVSVSDSTPLTVPAIMTKAGANDTCPVEAKAQAGEDPVWAAARKGQIDVVTRWLAEHQNDALYAPDTAAAAAQATHAAARGQTVRAVNRVDANGLGFLHIGAVTGNAALIRAACDTDGCDVEAANSSSDLTALILAASEGNAASLRALLEHGASVRAVNSDAQYRVGPVPVNVSGGKTALHFAAENGSDDCIAILLSCPDIRPDARDLDGNTALDFAMLKRNSSSAALLSRDASALLPWTDEAIHQKNLTDELARRKRILAATAAIAADSKTAIAEKYVPLHPHLYSLSKANEADVFVPEFLAAVRSGPVAIRAFVREVTAGVFTFPMFGAQFCADLLAEVDHYEREAKRLNLPLRRPNSMNAYGLILDDIGFSPVISQLRAEYVNALATVLLPESKPKAKHAAESAAAAVDVKSAPAATGEYLRSHHAFMVKYKVGEDLSLATHIDASDVTLNVCLGKQFTDGTLYFHHLKGSAADTERGNYQTPHLRHCKHCTLDYAHVKGISVLHFGRHIHGANPISSGERSNLIVWFRKQPPNAAAAPAATTSTATAAAAASAIAASAVTNTSI